MTKLGEICKFQSGGTPSKKNKEYFQGTIPWITTVALNGTNIDGNNAVEWITEKAIEESAAKIVPKESILVGTRVGVGKVAINSVTISTSQDIVSLIGIDTKKWDKGFLCKFISSKSVFLNEQARGATIKGIKIETLENLQLPNVTLNEQRKIAAVLDKVSDLIAKRRQQISKLDEMVKSRFVEMFGDPMNNSKCWDLQPLSNLCKDIYGGGTPSKLHPEYFEGNIPWVSPKDMKSDVITDSIDHITEEAIQNSSTKLVPKDAVLMVIRSGILKHTLPVAIAAVELTVNQDMKAFIAGENITSKFLMHYFKAIETDVLSGVRGVTADNIDFKEFQKRLVIVPPMELQNQFAAFVEQIEKTKTTISLSLEKLETLKKALMQEYFG